MTDKTASVVAGISPAADNTKKTIKVKNPKAKSTHPATSEMVNAAIKALAERNGSSLQAIKKYIASSYKVDAEKHALFIKKYLKSGVTTGSLVQTKGKGASGSFKLAVKKSEAVKAKPKTKPVVVKKVTTPKKTAVKKPAAKKADAAAKQKAKRAAVSPKKTVAAVKKTGQKKVVKAKIVKTKSPKAKKVVKAPTAKPKAPKPKKVTAGKAKTAVKKPAAQKK
uniref:H15 domain-containing protein n=1 Tax=Bracon brevicornis TaxID=1563983 RepID=A0A6V7HRV1_9HYME